ncbi:hypothetical protein N1851_034215 [Merluccius polli]|uniref:Endonuclease/exonuclease/phosphatase domain-containing protein n=1 Tax=Merluccius polli TaxID=89951 RepID=A0AA47LZY1_MERPO|nr:hypothetical protein N1851_034215 [Merluccius polli]
MTHRYYQPSGSKVATTLNQGNAEERGVRERIQRQPYRQPLPSITPDYRQSCLLCLTESWLTEADPDSADLEAFTPVRMDRSLNSGKKRGGGYCHPNHITTKHRVCTKDIELISLCLRPHHLPREIHQIRLFVVYVAPSADTQAAATILHELVSQAEAEAPDAADFITGDFNLCSLKEHLPHTSNMSPVLLATKPAWITATDAFYAKALPGLGNSDHNMIKLTSVYVPRLGREKVKKVEVKCWTTTATDALQDCLARTDWEVVTDGTDKVSDAAFAIAGYIQFCEDTVIPQKTVKMFPNNKPWATPELKHQKNCTEKD